VGTVRREVFQTQGVVALEHHRHDVVDPALDVALPIRSCRPRSKTSIIGNGSTSPP
jgi:hypothetical protein